MPFAQWRIPEIKLLEIDEVLLVVLRLSLSDINALDMTEYIFWAEAAECEIKRRGNV